MDRSGTETPSARTDRVRAQPVSVDTAADELSFDLRELLAGALRSVADATGASRAVAWAVGVDGIVFEATSVGERPIRAPDEATMDALCQLEGATDLTRPGADPVLAALSREAGLSAAAPVRAGGSEREGRRPIAALLLGFPRDGAKLVRPQTLAILDRVVKRLQAPAATAAAVARLRQLDEQVLRMTRLATIGDLLAEIVHEVRNPLVSVKTFLQLLPENLEDPDFHTNFRLVVVDEVRRMERLLDAVLQQARPPLEDASDPGTALGPVIESAGRLLEKRAQEKEQKLRIDVGADLPKAAIAEDPVRQIVLNLMLNAIEATPQGGRVHLTARVAADADGALEFIVDDQGPGVPEELRARLFDPFFSTRSERPVGLGLAVCSRLASEAGGSIAVEDSPEGGARFRVRLLSRARSR
jgi:signal transduction histidine kinase